MCVSMFVCVCVRVVMVCGRSRLAFEDCVLRCIRHDRCVFMCVLGRSRVRVAFVHSAHACSVALCCVRLNAIVCECDLCVYDLCVCVGSTHGVSSASDLCTGCVELSNITHPGSLTSRFILAFVHVGLAAVV